MKKLLGLVLTAASILSLSASASALNENRDNNRTLINGVTVGFTTVAFTGTVTLPNPNRVFCRYGLTTTRVGAAPLTCNILEKRAPGLNCTNEQRFIDLETALNNTPAEGGCSMFTTSRFSAPHQVTIANLYVGEDFRSQQVDNDRLEGVIVDAAGVDYDYDLRSP